MKCRLTKIKSTHNNVRTDVIEGGCVQFPILGFPFTMSAEPLTFGMDVRYFRSTPIKEIRLHEEPGFSLDNRIAYIFVTENSTYKLEVWLHETANNK